MNIQDELNKLDKAQRQELEKWFVEQIYKLNKVNRNEKLNYVPYVTRKQVVWVDFGVNVGQELNHSHPAVVLYSRPNVGTVLVAPLTSKSNESDVIIDIGEIKDFEGFSYCKIDQLRAVSKLRIQTKKHNGKYYNNFNLQTGEYSNPELTSEQMNLIDNAIQELRYKSK
ncbi:MAG: type II toxin-antitoxin system PemK/MazF family toxin [Clostridia bacterium]|nr:type II toxin-antitoxin system PemK/MazF family toxin [Clostridia bacterium]